MSTEIEYNILHVNGMKMSMNITLHKLYTQGVISDKEFRRYENASPFKGTKTTLVLYTINDFLLANPDYKVVVEAVIYG